MGLAKKFSIKISHRDTETQRTTTQRTQTQQSRWFYFSSLCLCASVTDFYSSQFQSRKTEQSKQDRQDQKAKHDLRFFPAHHFKVMMQRRHLKDAPTDAAGALG